MKRFHVHVAVPELATGIRFYSTLFGAEPAVRKDDYAKWMLDEPRINFAISQRGGPAGVNHLGFQVDGNAELEALHANLEAADRSVVAEKGANCCYARSDKYWVTDPAGIAWESFHTLGSIPMFGEAEGAAQDSACCAPAEGDAKSPSTMSSACCGPGPAKASSQTQSSCCAPAAASAAAAQVARGCGCR
jgi:catechol 2,3-dioxygenase-like lactoylglutathione lyase family enzyme